MLKILTRGLCWTLPFLFVLYLSLLHSQEEQRFSFSQRLMQLMEADLGQDSDIFTLSRFGRSTHRQGHDVNLPIPALIAGSFFRGQFQICLDWIEAAEDNDASFPLASLFTAGSLLEIGRATEARKLWENIPQTLRSTPMGERIRQLLSLGHQDYTSLLRDRQGRLIGGFNANGEFEFFEGVDETLIQGTILKEFAAGAWDSAARLSIDLELSKLALRALEWYRGSIVLLDPSSGEVLAAVSDARTIRRESAAAFQQRREPASIAKIITTSAALRDGLDPDSYIGEIQCRSASRYEGGILWCPYRGGQLEGLDEALAISCNVAFADLGVRLGRESILQELTHWGFNNSSSNPIAYGRILDPEGNERQLADLSIGLESLDITPLHAALMAAVLANDGFMPDPQLFLAQDGFLGLSPRPISHGEQHRVLQEEWVQRLVQAMQEVTGWRGTASGVAPPDFPVAMKTGTAAQWGSGYHVNYIGVGPLPNPQIAFCVRITHQPTSVHVNQAGRRVTRNLLQSLLDWMGRR